VSSKTELFCSYHFVFSLNSLIGFTKPIFCISKLTFFIFILICHHIASHFLHMYFCIFYIIFPRLFFGSKTVCIIPNSTPTVIILILHHHGTFIFDIYIFSVFSLYFSNLFVLTVFSLTVFSFFVLTVFPLIVTPRNSCLPNTCLSVDHTVAELMPRVSRFK
jgi:hypothetical protein